MKIGHLWKIGGDVWAPAASRIAGRPVGTTGAGRAAQTIQTLRTCGRSLFSYSSAPLQHSHTIVLTCCWTTGRQQPWWCHIWQQFTLRPSHQVANTNLQQTGDQSHGSLSSSPHTTRTRVLTPILLQCEHYDERIGAGSGVTVSPRDPGWLRHAATYSEASS